MNLAIGSATSRNSQLLLQMNKIDIDDLCRDESVDSPETLHPEAETDEYITDCKKEAIEQT